MNEAREALAYHASAAPQNQESEGHPTEFVFRKRILACAHVEKGRQDVCDDRACHCTKYSQQRAEYRERGRYPVRHSHNCDVLDNVASVREFLTIVSTWNFKDVFAGLECMKRRSPCWETAVDPQIGGMEKRSLW